MCSPTTHSYVIKFLPKLESVCLRGMESKPVSLTKQHDPIQNYSFPANLKYKSRVLIAANNDVYYIER